MKALVAASLLLVALAAPALADAEDVANDVAQKVMSPYCEGVTLHDCPSREAEELRARITAWAEDGAGEEAIIDRLVAEYGPQIRAVPPARGVGLVAWLLPALALAGGVAVATVMARRWSARRPGDVSSPRALTAEERAQLDAELDAMGEIT